MLTELLKSWKQVHRGWQHLHTALRTVHVDYTLRFVTDFARFRSLHVLHRVWHWFTESMSMESAKNFRIVPTPLRIPRYCQALCLLWLKSLWKILTEFTLDWLELLTVSCAGERSWIFAACLFVCLFCFVSFRFVLFCLFCFVLFCFVLFCFVCLLVGK